MNWDKINLFGFRALVEKVDERVGRILVPENRQMLYQIGRVVCVGNGIQPNGTTEKSVVAVGDLVYFQVNLTMAANQQYELGGKPYLNLHQGDLIGRLASNTVSYENFTPLGRWVLARPFLRENESGIILPATAAKDAKFVYFRVAKLGDRVNLDIKPGQEIMLNTGRLCPIFINELDIIKGEVALSEFGYIDRDFILGAVEEGAVGA